MYGVVVVAVLVAAVEVSPNGDSRRSARVTIIVLLLGILEGPIVMMVAVVVAL